MLRLLVAFCVVAVFISLSLSHSFFFCLSSNHFRLPLINSSNSRFWFFFCAPQIRFASNYHRILHTHTHTLHSLSTLRRSIIIIHMLLLPQLNWNDVVQRLSVCVCNLFCVCVWVLFFFLPVYLFRELWRWSNRATTTTANVADSLDFFVSIHDR